MTDRYDRLNLTEDDLIEFGMRVGQDLRWDADWLETHLQHTGDLFAAVFTLASAAGSVLRHVPGVPTDATIGVQVGGGFVRRQGRQPRALLQSILGAAVNRDQETLDALCRTLTTWPDEAIDSFMSLLLLTFIKVRDQAPVESEA